MTEEAMSVDAAALIREEARQMRASAEALVRAAAADRAQAEHTLGQCDHRRREIAQIEQSIAAREKWLAATGEDEMLKREAAAAKALELARSLMASYDKAKHAAALYLQRQIEADNAAKAAAA
jgi:hypothetical protein